MSKKPLNKQVKYNDYVSYSSNMFNILSQEIEKSKEKVNSFKNKETNVKISNNFDINIKDINDSVVVQNSLTKHKVKQNSNIKFDINTKIKINDKASNNKVVNDKASNNKVVNDKSSNSNEDKQFYSIKDLFFNNINTNDNFLFEEDFLIEAKFIESQSKTYKKSVEIIKIDPNSKKNQVEYSPKKNFNIDKNQVNQNKSKVYSNKIKGEFIVPYFLTHKNSQILRDILIQDNESCVIGISLYTGGGKTFGISVIVAEIVRKCGYKVPASVLMPFRAGIKPMYNYVLSSQDALGLTKIGYGMRGDTVLSSDDEVQLMTIGYWLEKFKSSVRNFKSIQDQIIVRDEAHDSKDDSFVADKLIRYAIKKGAKIKYIVASATIDPVEMMKTYSDVKVHSLTVEDANAKVENIFLEKQINYITKAGKLDKEVYDAIALILQDAWKLVEGNIIIFLPGKDEIEKMIQMIEIDINFIDAIVIPLHSRLSKEDIDLAIYPEEKKRYIIVATNMVENSITIPNTDCVIDCGIRKVLYISNEGVNSLKLSFACKSNMKQGAGRCGRQGKKGYAFNLMTQFFYELLPYAAINEVYINPLYRPIMSLIAFDLNPYEIFYDIDKDKISSNIEFLAEHEAILKTVTQVVNEVSISNEFDNMFNSDYENYQLSLKVPKVPKVSLKEDFKVTPIGLMMAKLPLSIRASQFLCNVLINLPNEYHYIGCVIAEWVSKGDSIFYRPTRGQRESIEQFKEKRIYIFDKQTEFYDTDCLETMIKAWFLSWIEGTTITKFYAWCKENFIFDKMIKEMQNSIRYLTKSCGDLGYVINEPNIEECKDHLNSFKLMKKDYIVYLKKAFSDWEFTPFFDIYKMKSKPFSKIKYNIDRLVPFKKTVNDKILALKLNEINPSFISMSNVIII